MSKCTKILAVAAVACGVLGSAGAYAADHEVKLLNKGAGGMMVFEPSLLKIAPGDTVSFVAADKGHNVESIEGMSPDGAAAITGKLNETVKVTFDKPGVYGVKCKPHYSMGMVGMIVVGDAANADAAKKIEHPGSAKKNFAKLFEELDTKKTAAQ